MADSGNPYRFHTPVPETSGQAAATGRSGPCPEAGKVLVTGASGFIGSNLVRRLAANGQEIACLLRPTSSDQNLLGASVSLIRGHLTDSETLLEAVRGKSVVYHVAGCLWTPRTADFYRVNEEGTRSLLEACSRLTSPPVVVFVSSIAAGGASLPARPRTESDAPAPVSHYGRSKLAAESAAREFAHAVPITVVRPPIVFGDGDRYAWPMFKTVARLGIHFVPGRVPHRYSMIYVRDLVEAIVLAAERGDRLAPGLACDPKTASRGIYFVGDDEMPTYADLGRMIGQALGRKRTWIVRVPLRIVRIIGAGTQAVMWIRRKGQFLNLDKVREITAGSWTCSVEKARAEFGFRTAAPLAERLRETVDWYRQAGWL